MDSSGEGRSDSNSAPLQRSLSSGHWPLPAPRGHCGAAGSLALPMSTPWAPEWPGLTGPALLPDPKERLAAVGRPSLGANRVSPAGTV